jgi:hypothetical protein
MLNPAARVLWRAADEVQLELGARAVILTGVQSEVIAALISPSTPAEFADTGDRPHNPDWAELDGLAEALQVLAAQGFVWPRPDPDHRSQPAALPPHLAGEIAALQGRHGVRADRVLRGRGEASVTVHGTGRLAVAIATLLASANVGRVHLHDSGDVHRHDCAPGGLLAADEGRRFNEAANDAVRRAAPGVDTTPMGPGERTDLALLTSDAPTEPDVRAWLHERGIAHLSARTGADDAVVGPLVLPGLTSCLRCADLTRLDRDPAWTALAVQLGVPRRHAGASDIGLTTLTAGLAVIQALAYLDGDEPTTLSSTLELRLPDWRLRRRSWPPHLLCECGVAASDTMGM